MLSNSTPTHQPRQYRNWCYNDIPWVLFWTRPYLCLMIMNANAFIFTPGNENVVLKWINTTAKPQGGGESEVMRSMKRVVRGRKFRYSNVMVVRCSARLSKPIRVMVMDFGKTRSHFLSIPEHPLPFTKRDVLPWTSNTIDNPGISCCILSQ